MKDLHFKIKDIQESYDLAAKEYATKCFDELNYKPFDRYIIKTFFRNY